MEAIGDKGSYDSWVRVGKCGNVIHSGYFIGKMSEVSVGMETE